AALLPLSLHDALPIFMPSCPSRPTTSRMNWAIAGLAYCGLYAALVWAIGDRTSARLLVGNAALLLPPFVPLAVIIRRRAAWRGRQAVFFGAIAEWAALWLIGQVGWASDEVLRSMPLPSVVGRVAAAAMAGQNPWRAVYARLAAGLILAFAVLIVLSFITLRGDYQTGSPADVGWMLPFWFAAWAADTAPASVVETHSITASV